MSPLNLGPAGLVRRFASRLKFPHLFWLTAALFVLDVMIPDLIPFADEVLLALLSLLFATWRKGPEAIEEVEQEREVKNVTPRPPAERPPRSG
jgi:Family of unknown function (DUF6116)